MVNGFVALVLAAMIAMAPVAMGQEKKTDPKVDLKIKEEGNSDKIVGSWEMQDADLTKIDGKATFEFTKDGKAKMSIVIGKQDPIQIEGSYKVEDKNKLTLIVKKGDKDASETVDIKLVNDSELVFIDKQKKEVKFKKPEPKMPKDPFPKGSFPKSPFPMEPFPQ
jgi:uncharacterized protein (TIGR03066 family)